MYYGNRTRAELAALGLVNQRLVVNGVFRADGRDDPVARALETRGRTAMAGIPVELASLPRGQVPLRPFGMVGIDALRAMLACEEGNGPAMSAPPAGRDGRHLPPPLAPLISEIAAAGRGVVMTMGKGGVGNVAELARMSLRVARLLLRIDRHKRSTRILAT